MFNLFINETSKKIMKKNTRRVKLQIKKCVKSFTAIEILVTLKSWSKKCCSYRRSYAM